MIIDIYVKIKLKLILIQERHLDICKQKWKVAPNGTTLKKSAI